MNSKILIKSITLIKRNNGYLLNWIKVTNATSSNDDYDLSRLSLLSFIKSICNVNRFLQWTGKGTSPSRL